MTAYQLAANLISSYSIRTAYYAVTKNRDRAVQIPWSQNRRQTSPNACVTVTNRAIGTGAIAPFPN